MMPLAFLSGSPGAGELLLLFFVILLLFGSKRLPSIARTLGRTLEEFRKAARDFSHDIMHADTQVPGKTHKPEPPDAAPPEDIREETPPEYKDNADHAG